MAVGWPCALIICYSHEFRREFRCPCWMCWQHVCVFAHMCVCLSVTLRSYITASNRKARGSLQRAQYEPSTAEDRMSLSYLALYSFTSPSPSVSPPGGCLCLPWPTTQRDFTENTPRATESVALRYAAGPSSLSRDVMMLHVVSPLLQPATCSARHVGCKMRMA